MTLDQDPIWSGALIEESLENEDLLEMVDVIDTRTGTLESEAEAGDLTFDSVEVFDNEIEQVVACAMKTLKPSWYFHLVNEAGDTMIVMFKGKKFMIKKGDEKGLEEVKAYGISQGIHEDQLELGMLFEDPFA